MKLLDMKQGSQEWLELRKKCVTSTDSAIINGTNTFSGNTPFKLWQRKLGLADEIEVNEIMQEGIDLEPKALELYNKTWKIPLKPAVVLHSDLPWLMASIDGYNGKRAAEIKCGVKAYELALDGIIPPYYQDQMNHAMFALSLTEMDYVAYRPGEMLIAIPYEFDDEVFTKTLEKEKLFYDCLKNMTPPKFTNRDYTENIEVKDNELAEKWKVFKDMETAGSKGRKAIEAELNERSDGSCIYKKAGLRRIQVIAKGTVNWQVICEKYAIPDDILESERKDPKQYYRFSSI